MARPRTFDQQQVVDAALQAFWDGGLASTSVDDLLNATGLSRSSMYQCVGNRDAWLRLAVDRYVEGQVAMIQRVFARGSLADALRRLFRSAATDNYGGRGCLLGNGVNALRADQAANLDVVRQGYARLAAQFAASVRQRAPELADADVVGRCVEIMVAIAGLRTMQRAGVPKARLVAAADRYARMLSDTATPGSPSP